MLSFKLGGSAEVPPGKAPLGPVPEPTYSLESSAEEREKGVKLFHFYCSVCHGPQAVAGGSVPDLRHLSAENHALFEGIVRGGLREVHGMPGFADLLSESDTHAIHAWVLQRAKESVGGM